MSKRQLRAVPLDELSDNELRVLFAAHANGPSKIGDLARVAWADWHVPMHLWAIAETKFDSWVRNSLRRLVASGWMRQLGPGTYAAAESLDARLLGLQVAEAEEAHDAAERAFKAADDRIEALRRELRDMLEIRRTRGQRVAATWKALLAARKAVR